MDKKDAKKYIISLSLLFFAGGALIFGILLAAKTYGAKDIPLSALQLALVSAGCAAVPAGSYAGFCSYFLKKEELTKKESLFIAFLFPLFLLFITVYGIIMIIPSLIKSIEILRG